MVGGRGMVLAETQLLWLIIGEIVGIITIHHWDTILTKKMQHREERSQICLPELQLHQRPHGMSPRYIDEILAASENPVDCEKMLPRQAAERRQAISYMYVYMLRRPPEADWARLHVVKCIMLALRIPDGSFHLVKECLCEIEKQTEQNPDMSFNSADRFKKRVKHYLIEEDSIEAHIVYEGAVSDLSSYNIAVLVNLFSILSRPISGYDFER